MGLITRRNFVKAAAAGLAAPALLRRARAAEPLKVGFVYLGPIGDYGWTWAHERAARRWSTPSRARSSPTMSRT